VSVTGVFLLGWKSSSNSSYRATKTHRMPYLYMSFPQKRHEIIGAFTENNLQLKASNGSSSPCMLLCGALDYRGFYPKERKKNQTKRRRASASGLSASASGVSLLGWKPDSVTQEHSNSACQGFSATISRSRFCTQHKKMENPFFFLATGTCQKKDARKSQICL